MIALRPFLAGVATGILLAALWLTPLGRATLTYLLEKWGISASRYLTNTPTCPQNWTCQSPSPSPMS